MTPLQLVIAVASLVGALAAQGADTVRSVAYTTGEDGAARLSVAYSSPVCPHIAGEDDCVVYVVRDAQTGELSPAQTGP